MKSLSRGDTVDVTRPGTVRRDTYEEDGEALPRDPREHERTESARTSRLSAEARLQHNRACKGREAVEAGCGQGREEVRRMGGHRDPAEAREHDVLQVGRTVRARDLVPP